MSRNQKRSPAVESPESAALVSQEAGLPAEGGGPVSRPAWAPGDVDLIKVPEPAYRKLVARRCLGSGVRDQPAAGG